MSKQDRQAVRSATGLEQKYNLGRVISEQRKTNARMEGDIDRQSMTLREFISYATHSIDTFTRQINTINGTLETLGEADTELGSKIDTEIEEQEKAFDAKIKAYWNTIYPVGSIYVSVTETDPGTLFGGTWERIQDRFLLASGSGYAAGSTGGEAEHTLLVEEMPSHNHTPSNTGLFYTTRGTGSSEIKGFTAGESFSESSENGGVSRTSGTSLAGGSQPHNNMPPYLAVYMWKRTA